MAIKQEGVLTISEFPTTFTLEYPYTRTLGPVIGPFLTALRDGRILGIRCGSRVLCPPLEFDPDTGETLSPDFVEVGPAGCVEFWTWIAEPSRKHPFQEPFAFAQVKLDGADTAMTHAVKAAGPEAMSAGMRVKAQFREERTGAITDVYFVPEGDARDVAIAPGEGEVAISTHLISLTFEENLYPSRARYAQGLLDGKFIGQRSPVNGTVSIPGKGYDPLARVLMTEADDVELASTGTATSFTVITPIQYKGQTETEPYVSASIFLDGADQALSMQNIYSIPVDEFREGMRLRAIFKPAAERNVDNVDNSWMIFTTGNVIERWEPTGEPDVPPEEFPEQI
ncbi:MAG: OB-fold domain-containing protein [Deltaproteobacteria bacterium]|nr:OB-fold domain-containing protein [Deltaproteobacteria bacterium]MBW2400094.1 OB-fold domain-containing protein [Deltaproteobacteria bacterium]